MTVGFRIFLILMAVLAFWIMIRNIRRSKMLISDCLFWFFFSLVIVLLAVFPQIDYFFAGLLGIQSPVNLVFLAMIAVLLFRNFKLTLRISELETKVKNITQNIAIYRHDHDKENKK